MAGNKLLLEHLKVKEFNLSKNYNEILTSDYGDYMQLPPVEQRVSHHDFKLWKIVKKGLNDGLGLKTFKI